MDSANSIVLSVEVSDRFGDSGLTGVCILIESNENPRAIEIDSFLLSCRILGRRIEESFMDYVLTYCQSKQYELVFSKYLKTKKNGQVKDFYNDYQFKIEDETDIEINYRFEIVNYISKNPKFITRKLK